MGVTWGCVAGYGGTARNAGEKVKGQRSFTLTLTMACTLPRVLAVARDVPVPWCHINSVARSNAGDNATTMPKSELDFFIVESAIYARSFGGMGCTKWSE